jgi:hypothetical protein
MGRIMKIILLFLVIIVVAIQFYRPNKNEFNPVTLDDFLLYEKAPENVKTLLINSCYDCHSNQTNYVWFDNIAPVSWIVDKHIMEGKSKLNLSEWAIMDYRDKRRQLSLIATQITDDVMPLKSYLNFHSDSKLSKSNKDAILKWLFTIEVNN